MRKLSKFFMRMTNFLIILALNNFEKYSVLIIKYKL